MTIPRVGVERSGVVVLLHTQERSERVALLSEALLYDKGQANGPFGILKCLIIQYEEIQRL